MITTTQRFLKKHPICCFCGGNTPATTRDHVPAKGLFDGKHRPDQLVFPSCKPCQEASKKHELVAAMMARIYPDARTRSADKEVPKYLRRVSKAVPGLLEEMQPSPTQQARFKEIRNKEPGAAGVLSARGPLLNRSLELFGVKLTAALCYQHVGRIVGLDEAISVRIYTNVDAILGKLPQTILDLMGEPVTLMQGQWSVPNQFWYQYAITASRAQAVFFAAFRRSFAILGVVWEHVSNVPPGEGLPTYTPSDSSGFLRSVERDR